MDDNRNLTGVFHQKVSSLPMIIASDSRSFHPHEYALGVTKYSISQLPVKAV